MAQEPLQVERDYAVLYKRKKRWEVTIMIYVDKLMANPRPEDVQDLHYCENIMPRDCSTKHQ